MSRIKVDNIETTGGVGLYPARAWVVYDQYPSQTLKSSANVSSIADMETGKTTINFSTAFSDGNYVTAGACGGAGTRSTGGGAVTYDGDPATVPLSTSATVDTFIATVGASDYNYVSVMFLD